MNSNAVMATALGNEAPSVAREHPRSLVCDGSPMCHHCGGWQCGDTEDKTRRHSDTKRPATVVPPGWPHSPHLSCPVSPRVRPATAIGWGEAGGTKKSLDKWSSAMQQQKIFEAHGELDDSSSEVSGLSWICFVVIVVLQAIAMAVIRVWVIGVPTVSGSEYSVLSLSYAHHWFNIQLFTAIFSESYFSIRTCCMS